MRLSTDAGRDDTRSRSVLAAAYRGAKDGKFLRPGDTLWMEAGPLGSVAAVVEEEAP